MAVTGTAHVKVSGMRELGEAFALAPQNLERRVMAQATRAGGQVFVAELEARAPRRSGALVRKIAAKYRIIAQARAGYGLGLAIIGIRYEGLKAKFSRRPGRTPSSEDPAVYAGFLERGTRNMPARPFVRPAFDAGADKAEQAFAAKARALLGELVAK